MGGIKGDTRGLDYRSHGFQVAPRSRCRTGNAFTCFG